MSIRKAIITKNKNTVVAGIDKVSGVFLQFQDMSKEEMTILNFSEFSPFDRRFTAENVLKAIKNNEVLKSDFDEACQIVIGNYKVYFRGIGLDVETEPDNFEFPKRLQNHYEKGTGFKVQTIGDYFKLLKLFKHPLMFGEVQWYMNHPKVSMELYNFQNDEVTL